MHLGIELDAGDVCRGAGASEDIDNDEVDLAQNSAGKCAHDGAGIAIAAPNRRVSWQRQVFAHKIDQVGFDLDDLLARTGVGDRDISGDRQSAGAKVDCGQSLARLKSFVDDVAHPGDVLEMQFIGVRQVDVALRCSVNGEHPSALPPGVGFNFGQQAAEFQPVGMNRGHTTIVPVIGRSSVKNSTWQMRKTPVM